LCAFLISLRNEEMIRSGWFVFAIETYCVIFVALAISFLIKELVSSFIVGRGTWELASRDRSFHSFRWQSLEKGNNARGSSLMTQFNLITAFLALRRYCRAQETLRYDISRFYLITWQEEREKIEGKGREAEDRGRCGWLSWRIYSYLLLPVE